MFKVVAIGVASRDIEKVRALLRALPPATGSIFLLVQYGDAIDDGITAEMLSEHSRLSVGRAIDSAVIEAENLYIAPAGLLMTIEDGRIRLRSSGDFSSAEPFRVLAQAVAAECGPYGIAVDLSAGWDASVAVAISKVGGLVLTHDMQAVYSEADPDNVPPHGGEFERLQIGRIADRIVNHLPRAKMTTAGEYAAVHLAAIADLLKQSMPVDFFSSEHDDLKRQIGSRLARLDLSGEGLQRYIAVLRESAEERQALASELLINPPDLFTDRAAFDHLRDECIPAILGSKMPDETVRVWVAGCSTGEEAYSLATLLLDRTDRLGSTIKLQIFASDADADAIAVARQGHFTADAIKALPPALLQSYFQPTVTGYVANARLRASIVFSVQDMLLDPPFTRIDLLFCRNRLIRLQPEEQAQILAAFSFSLRDSGILLIGRSEKIPGMETHFRQVFDTGYMYRRIGNWRAGDYLHDFLLAGREPAGNAGIVQRPHKFADLVFRTLLDRYVPASILISRKYEYLYSWGPTSKILHIAPGPASRDLFKMTPKLLHNKIRSAIRHASEDNKSFAVGGARIEIDGVTRQFSVHAEPLRHQGEDLYLLCFIEAMPCAGAAGRAGAAPATPTYVAQLEHALAEARSELGEAIRNLEIAADEQRISSAEEQSLNEAYRCINEELVAETRELQARNEDLEARNHHVQERLGEQQALAGSRHDMLHSIDLPMVFLDEHLNIRFLTPAANLLFNISISDIARPLSDLSVIADDIHLNVDVIAARNTGMPSDKEVEGRNGHRYIRRISPYRTGEGKGEGVVITFIDTEVHRQIASHREPAKRSAEFGTQATSHFSAAVNDDLRQPLQTHHLLQCQLEDSVENDQSRLFVKRMGDTLASMSGILNINEIEAGMVQPWPENFFLADILERLRDEFAFQAVSKGVDLQVMTSGSAVHTDPRLLEQILRNLLSNALKYTQAGRILVGCRYRGKKIRLEVWGTGIGIPGNQAAGFFDQYHQLETRVGSRGSRLSLSIGKRLSDLLDLNVSVRSGQKRGAVFSIEVQRATLSQPLVSLPTVHQFDHRRDRPAATILVIQNGQSMPYQISTGLEQVGYIVAATANINEALGIIQRGKFTPEAIIVDDNLAQGVDVLTLIAEVRRMLGREVPALVLTDNISSHTAGKYVQNRIPHLNKPAQLRDIIGAIDDLLASGVNGHLAEKRAPVWRDMDDDADKLIEFIGDDQGVRNSVKTIFKGTGWSVVTYVSAEEYLSLYSADRASCLMVDTHLPGMGGLELLRSLKERGHRFPVIVIGGRSDVRMAVEAMRLGASDFIEKPFSDREIQASVHKAGAMSPERHERSQQQEEAQDILGQLTRRQRQILGRIVAGQPNKIIAAEMEISQRTVENHRASIMRRTRAASFPALLRLVARAEDKVGF